MKTETLEALGAAGNKTTIAAGATTLWAWFTSNEFLGLAGLAVGVGGLLVTWHYKRQANQRQEAEHELRMQRLRRGMDSDTDLGTLGAEE